MLLIAGIVLYIVGAIVVQSLQMHDDERFELGQIPFSLLWPLLITFALIAALADVIERAAAK